MDEQNVQNNNEGEIAKKTSGSKYKFSFAFIILLLALLAGGALYYLTTMATPSEELQINLSDLNQEVPFEMPSYPEVVAVVNGEEVLGANMQLSVSQVAQAAAAQGDSPSDPTVMEAIEAQALDVLVNTVLLQQAAVAAGIAIDEAAVDAALSEFKAQYATPEEFTEAVEAMGLSEEQIRENLSDRMLIDMYLETETEINSLTVTPEELQAQYEATVAGVENAPSLEEIASYLEPALLAQKQQVLVSEIIDSLRAEAQIEELL